MAIDYPNSPSAGDHHTHGGKTWTFHDGKWALNVASEGVRGPAGVAFQGTAPATTDVLWADTSTSGVAVLPIGGATGQMLTKASSTSYDAVWATPVTSGDLALKADLASPTFTGTPTLPTGTVATTQTAADSTTAIATTAFVTTADNLKANLASPTFTGTVSGVTKSMVGLGSVDNTADTAKPVSTAQQTALDLKAPLASPALTGTPTAPTAAAATNTTQIATTEFVRTEVANLIASAPAALDTLDELAAALGDDANFATTTATSIGLKAPLASPALTGTPTAPTAAVGTSTTQLATTEFVQIANPTGAVIAFAGSSAPSGWLLCSGQEVAIASYGTLYAVVSTTYGSLTNGSNGVGTTHFRVPDLRGRTVVGVGTGTGLTARALAATTGAETVTLTSAQSGVPAHAHVNTAAFTGTLSTHTHIQPSHNHSVYDPSHGHSFTPRWGGSSSVGVNMSAPSYGTPYGIGGGYVEGSYAYTSNYGTTATNNNTDITPAGTVAMTNVANATANAASAHDNMQPTMVLNYIIKA